MTKTKPGLLLAATLAFSLIMSGQSFTKLNDPSINSRTGDWFALAPVDIDNNYTLELVLGNNGPNAYFLHSDSLEFTYNATDNFVAQTGTSYGGFWADLDNDCDLDVFWPNQTASGNNYLYENNGDGTFTRVLNSVLRTDAMASNSGCWADYDNDGLVDLLVLRRGTNGLPNFLYRNNGNFTFTKIDTGATAQTARTSSGAAWADYDLDGDLDFVVANRDNWSNEFYINNGNGSFTRDTSSIIVKDSSNSSGCSWGDYNNDGYPDLFVTNVVGQKNHLYTNNGNGSFTKVLTGSIVNDQHNTFGAIWTDFDNDGYLDMFVANNSNIWPKNNLLYHNNGNGTFSKLTSGSQYSETLETFGTTAADLNEDGFVDIINPNRYSGPVTIHLNDGNSNGYLHLNLYGTSANRAAIGARVVAKSALGIQTRSITQQTGYNNQDDLSIKMGFDQDTIIDTLTIYWPGGSSCSFTNITPEGFYNIEQGTCLLDTVPKPAFRDSSSYLGAFFTNKSRGALSRYHWDFGDGDTSNLSSPLHRYASSGKYQVTLTVYDNYCKHRSFSDSIEVCPDTVSLGFVDTHQSLTVNFIDTSNSTAYDITWDFDDNSPLGSGSSVSHTYATAGTYNVCLTLTDSCRTKTYCRQINVCADTIIAGFGFQGTGFTRTFNDSSVNAPTLNWNFGDGTSSSAASPAHTFVQPGTYYVCQTATDSCTSTTFCDTVKICLDSLVADFNLGKTGKQVSFSDHSINANTYQWNFGDGNTSTQTSPNHTYATYGSYTACLVVTNDCFTDTLCEAINICPDTLEAGFGFNKSAYNVSFSDSSINASTINWDFGDGNSASGNSPSHTYSSPGAYYVCQTVTTLCDTNTYCDTVEVCLDIAQANFSVTANGQIYTFSNLSQHADNYSWDFGDGNFSTSPSPSHVFANYGVYTVCLSVSNDCYTDTLCKTVNVCATQGVADYDFKDSFAPLAIQFTDKSTHAVSYLWDFDDGSSSINKNPLKVFSNPIVYNVCLTITDSCGLQDSTCQSVDLTKFGAYELEMLQAIDIFPNPTTSKVQIEIGALTGEITAHLTNLTGKILMTTSIWSDEDPVILNLDFLPSGVYLLTLTVENESKVVKVIKH